MEKFIWDEQLETGIESIDTQHKVIIEKANSIVDEFEKGMEEFIIKKNMTFFLTYAMNHFSDEEEFMNSIGFPGIEEHMKEHKLIRERLNHFIDHKLEDNNEEFVYFLTHYWIRHILDFDFVYVKLYREKEK